LPNKHTNTDHVPAGRRFAPASHQASGYAERPSENSEDEERSEWVVGVKWIKAVPKAQAKTFTGVFANQNVVCKLRHEQTLKFVQREFGE
jgi:hypothetical protein